MVLEQLQGEEKLKGLRHIVQAETDENFLLRDEYAWWFSVLREYFAELGAAEQERVFGGTAAAVYRL